MKTLFLLLLLLVGLPVVAVGQQQTMQIKVYNRNAYVNLRDLTGSSSIGNFTTSCGGSNFYGQVESTLKQFRGVRKVFFAFAGDPSHFYDWMQIGECPRELRNCDASNFIK